MKTTCLVSNYNYQEFVIEAVESALNQTRKFDEIIVVDDGSSDRSREILEEAYSSHSDVRLIFKENGGQMSCFYEGYSVSKGDIIFFLDADDLYEENYLEDALDTYESMRCDFLFCSHVDFAEADRRARHHYDRTLDLGYSVLVAMHTDCFRTIGNVTSTLSMKRDCLGKLFPYPFMNDWRIQADWCLVIGSSLAGARKAYRDRPLVLRRIHGKNSYARGLDKDRKARRYDKTLQYGLLVRETRFRGIIANRLGIDASAAEYINNEFISIPTPTRYQLKQYLGILDSSDLKFIQKIRKKVSIYKHYLSSNLKGSTRATYLGSVSYRN